MPRARVTSKRARRRKRAAAVQAHRRSWYALQREFVRARPRSVRLDGNPPRLHFGLLRNAHLEHAVGLASRDLLGVGPFRQREATHEGSSDPLDALIAILAGTLLGAALAADGQHAVLGRDVDVLGLDTGDVRQHDETVLLLVHIHARRPGRGPRAGSFGGT